eukprot:5336304-Pleurochrysis_carterae.AAC.1
MTAQRKDASAATTATPTADTAHAAVLYEQDTKRQADPSEVPLTPVDAHRRTQWLYLDDHGDEQERGRTSHGNMQCGLSRSRVDVARKIAYCSLRDGRFCCTRICRAFRIYAASTEILFENQTE